MVNILVEIRKYGHAYKEFVEYLQKADIKNVSAFLTLRDELAYGFIIEFMQTKGCSILHGMNNIYIVVDAKHKYTFSTVTHKELHIIFYSDTRNLTTFKAKMNIAIHGFFKSLQEIIL